MRITRKKIFNVMVTIVVGLYLSASVGLYLYQDNLLYNPDNFEPEITVAINDGLSNLKKVEYKSSDGVELYAWMQAPKKGKKMILFLHGNSYNLAKFHDRLVPLGKSGYGIFMAEFRGFGGNKGEIKQENLEKDASAALAYLHSIGYKNKDIVVYGFSLGTYLATNLVYSEKEKGKFDGLILEAPFTSVLDIAKYEYAILPVRYFLKDYYESDKKIDDIETRLLIAHGTFDIVVPYIFGKKLFEKAEEPKEFYSIPTGRHSNLTEYKLYNKIIDWIG